MPVLGVVASSISGHLWVPEGAYDALASVTLTADVYSINVAIPSGYKNLLIRGWNLSNNANNAVVIRLNNDSSASYDWQAVDAPNSGATPSGFAILGSTYAIAGYTATTSYPAPSITQINDIDSTNKYKVVRAFGGNYANNTTVTYMGTYGSTWKNLSPVTSLTIAHGSAVNLLKTGTTLNVYGVK